MSNGIVTSNLSELATAVADADKMLAALESKPKVRLPVNAFNATLEANVVCSFGTIWAVTQYVPGKSGVTLKSRSSKVPASECGVVWPVTKAYSVTFPLGAGYESMVNKQLVRETDGEAEAFKSEGYRNGLIPINKFFAKHEGTERIHMRVNVPAATKKVAFGFSKWLDGNGNELAPEKVAMLKADFLKKESEDSGRQGTEDAVLHLTPLMANVKAVVVGGVVYELIGTDSEEGAADTAPATAEAKA